jgi:hypothetical protein
LFFGGEGNEYIYSPLSEQGKYHPNAKVGAKAMPVPILLNPESLATYGVHLISHKNGEGYLKFNLRL